MTYATQQDLEERFGPQELAQLTDPDAGAVIDATVVARALSDAAAEIDARLSTRGYTLPLATVPTVLVRVAADLARYFLWDARASEQVRNRYRDAIGLLDKIGSGAIVLPGAETLELTPGAVAVASSSPARQFSDTALGAFAPPV